MFGYLGPSPAAPQAPKDPPTPTPHPPQGPKDSGGGGIGVRYEVEYPMSGAYQELSTVMHSVPCQQQWCYSSNPPTPTLPLLWPPIQRFFHQ